MTSWAEAAGAATISRAPSVSLAVADLIMGPSRSGVGLGRGYVLFDAYVLALTPLGGPRMPNGVECPSTFHVARGQEVRVGHGAVVTEGQTLILGPGWDPVPRRPSPALAGPPARLDPEVLAGRGPGLTPAGDDILIGYVAALGLGHCDWAAADEIAERAAGRTTSLSAALLRHAARGELPEPAHALLERGDPAPLLAFGHSSGRCLILGLSLGGLWAVDRGCGGGRSRRWKPSRSMRS